MVCLIVHVTILYFLTVHISYIWNYLPHVPSPMSMLAKTTEVTSVAWQCVMQICCDERIRQNGESKTKEDKSTLFKTIDFANF